MLKSKLLSIIVNPTKKSLLVHSRNICFASKVLNSKSRNVVNRPRKQFNFIANAAEKTAPAVVYIEIHNEAMRRYVSQARDRKQQPVGAGSGFIVTDYGIILTNAHVVNQATSLKVQLPSSEIFDAHVIDTDPIADLAVLQINIKAQNLSTVSLGNSTNIRPGEWVVALGSPLNLSNTVTAGIVSAVHRGGKDLGLKKGTMNYIQTDAAINRGNSGGPLINLDSEVIGINAMTLLNTTGISFAVPIDRAKAFLLKSLEKQELRKSGKSPKTFGEARPYIGLKMMTLTPDIENQLRYQLASFPDVSYGVLVVDVVHNSPAYTAGLRPHDVIIEADGVMLSSTEHLSDFVNLSREFNITVLRGPNSQRVPLRVKPQTVKRSLNT